MSQTREQARVSARKWREKNPGYTKLYYEKNKDIVKKRRQVYVEYYNSLPTTKLRIKLWQRNNHEKVRLALKARNANMNYSGKIYLKDIQRLYEDNIKKFGTLTCVICQKPIIFGDDSLDHNFSATRGGTNAYDNLQIAHTDCNTKKRDKTLQEVQNAQAI